MGPGSTVIVTRAQEQIEPLVSRREAFGLTVVRCPLIRLEPVGPDLIDVEGYDWVVVTSAFGARELLRRASGLLPRIAAIGPGTATALASGGAEASFVP